MSVNEAVAARAAAKDRYALAVEYSRTEVVTRYRVEYRAACDRVCEERARVAAEAEAEAERKFWESFDAMNEARYAAPAGFDVDAEVDRLRDEEMLDAMERDTQAEIAHRWTDDYDHEMEGA